MNRKKWRVYLNVEAEVAVDVEAVNSDVAKIEAAIKLKDMGGSKGMFFVQGKHEVDRLDIMEPWA